jgi:hypothetical protein
MKTLKALGLGAVLALASPAQAGEDHSHAAKHGGQIVESGHHHLEIVTKDGALDIHVQGEDGKPEDVSGAKATATILSEGKKVDVALSPTPANTLSGTGSFKAVKGTTLVITLTLPGHAPEQARLKLD